MFLPPSTRKVGRSPTHHKQQHDCDSARPFTLVSVYIKKKSKRVIAFHRVRDIDRPAPLSGGSYEYAIQEKSSSKTVDTKGLGRAEFFLRIRSDFHPLVMMGKFDVLEPCGALKTKGPPARVHAVWRAVELRQKNHDQSLYPSGRIKGKRRRH
jgi:hypothetical protein